jgi:lysophospholipase L1-like esterase
VTRTIVCFGDSNTHGANPAAPDRYSRSVRWPGVLQATLRERWHVIEEGLGGRTTVFEDPFSEGRSARPYLVPCLESHKPVDLLTIMLGTNDLKAYNHVTPQEITKGMQTLVRMARRSETGPSGGAPAILVMAPAPLGPLNDLAGLWGFGAAEASSRELAPLYRLMAEEEGVQFLDAGDVAAVDPAEGVHLTAESHRALGLAVAARVTEWFPSD